MNWHCPGVDAFLPRCRRVQAERAEVPEVFADPALHLIDPLGDGRSGLVERPCCDPFLARIVLPQPDDPSPVQDRVVGQVRLQRERGVQDLPARSPSASMSAEFLRSSTKESVPARSWICSSCGAVNAERCSTSSGSIQSGSPAAVVTSTAPTAASAALLCATVKPVSHWLCLNVAPPVQRRYRSIKSARAASSSRPLGGSTHDV